MDLINEFFDIFNHIVSNPIILFSIGFSLISVFISTIMRAIKHTYKEYDDFSFSDDKEEKIVYKKVFVTPKIKKDIPNICVNCGAQLNGKDICEYCGTKY